MSQVYTVSSCQISSYLGISFFNKKSQNKTKCTLYWAFYVSCLRQAGPGYGSFLPRLVAMKIAFVGKNNLHVLIHDIGLCGDCQGEAACVSPEMNSLGTVVSHQHR